MAEHTPAPTSSRGIYGFVLYLLLSTLFSLYVLWAFIPDSIYEKFNITELPSKYFVLFIPILILTATTLFAFFIYPSMSFIMTPNINSIKTVVDSHSVRRCQHKLLNGVQCDNKISFQTSSLWHYNNICDNHQDREVKNVNFCDCIEKNKCLLSINSNYIEELNMRNSLIKNSGDLDIIEVAEILYGID